MPCLSTDNPLQPPGKRQGIVQPHQGELKPGSQLPHQQRSPWSKHKSTQQDSFMRLEVRYCPSANVLHVLWLTTTAPESHYCSLFPATILLTPSTLDVL